MASTTQIYYLERLKLFETEKPYMVTFDLPPGLGPKTNHAYAPSQVSVCDAQSQKDEFSLDIHGFQFHDWVTNLQRSEDFDSPELVKSKYYPETVAHMMRTFPDALEIHVLTHLRRKRDESFLGVAVKEPDFYNPIVYAHTDFTPLGAAVAIESLLQRNPHLRGRKYDMINVWRTTNRHANRDWPLGLCDFTTVSPEDIEFNDVIHKDHIGESLRVYANDNHKWYFLDRQSPNQVCLFRNVHSDGLSVPFGVHLALPNPFQEEDESDRVPRESIEMRMNFTAKERQLEL